MDWESSGIHKVVSDFCGEVTASESGKEALVALVQAIVKAFVKGKEEFTLEAIQKTIEDIIPGELKSYAKGEFLKACCKVNDIEEKKETGGDGGSGASVTTEEMQTASDVHISIPAVSKLLDESLNSPVPPKVAMGMAALCQYMMAEVVELSNNQRKQIVSAKDPDPEKAAEARENLTEDHIKRGIRSDPLLEEFFQGKWPPLSA
uniref:Uncharacterized protein n=1 Tax=Chromera velia CCMP2878 TaxID=1169474 RepID=A0A0G4HNH2_9ALVE|eukprot:Cvel_7694.t1-p1 / transcript=Cvel_7694.t1 / gene=Cvel_7694 / organism=Chromera_velia_CCMP2878 / gene_product=hypothetical protein / transcript_product=hypothetical protein / location=Cvel_scaffold408:69220-69831(-) / protein_length=204 / sequence_SO=supercontig / SO=protein_coding / is_pseudo=false